MLSVALAALRSRRAQSVALGLLAGLVAAGAVGTPFYVYAATERIVTRHVAAAPAIDRSVALTAHVDVDADGVGAVDNAARVLAGIFSPADTTAVTGLRTAGSLHTATGTGEAVPVAYRDDVCAHVALRGACPAADDEAMISDGLATALGIRLGDTVDAPLTADPGTRPTVRVVGIYTPVHSGDAYWGDHLLTATESPGNVEPDAVFMTRHAVLAAAQEVVVERMVVVDGFVSDIDALAGDYADINARGLANFSVESSLPTLIDGIRDDTDSLLRTVPVLAGEIIALGWFALFIVLRALGVDRRSDVGLVLLRGLPRRQMWWLFTAQSCVPIFVALPFGAALGYLVARISAGVIRSADTARLALIVSGGALVLVTVGALVAATFADRRRRGTPITDLMRITPARRRGWRSDAVDIAVVCVAVLGVVQGHLSPPATRPVFAALVPALVALAAGLVAARLVAPVAGALVGRGLRAGRPTVVLTATYLARRPGLDRTLALLTVTTTLAATAVLSSHLAAGAQAARARIELGADRVLSVATTSPVAVLTATRTADPAGRYLMAAASYTTDTAARVLAVDSTRLARVMTGGADPGGLSGRRLAALLKPTAPTPVAVASGPLTLRLRIVSLPAAPAFPTFAEVDLVAPDGTEPRAVFGPLDAATTVYQAPVAGCDGGCRFVGVELGRATVAGTTLASVTAGRTVLAVQASGASVAFGSLDQAAALPIDFTDRSRWRTTLDRNSVGPVVSVGTDGLTVTVPSSEPFGAGTTFDPHVYLVDSPIPLPAVTAVGPRAGGTVGVPEVRPFGGGSVPIRVVASQPLLPLVGASGAIVDLDYALHATDASGAVANSQIWLRADTPAAVIARLRGDGVTISGEESLGDAEAGYRDQVPETIRRVSLALALIGTALSVIAILVMASVERRSRSTELAALRTQGIGATTARRVAVAGYLSYAAVAVVVGLAGAALVLAVRVGGFVVFSDPFTALPVPGLYPPGGWLLTAVVCAVPVLAAAWVAGRQLVRAVRHRGSETVG